MICIPCYWKKFREVTIYCIWDSTEEISTEEFQKFINGGPGQGFGIDALMNICESIDISLMDRQTPYPRVFISS